MSYFNVRLGLFFQVFFDIFWVEDFTLLWNQQQFSAPNILGWKNPAPLKRKGSHLPCFKMYFLVNKIKSCSIDYVSWPDGNSCISTPPNSSGFSEEKLSSGFDPNNFSEGHRDSLHFGWEIGAIWFRWGFSLKIPMEIWYICDICDYLHKIWIYK